MKINIIVATHGFFGQELVKSAEMIVGSTENVYHLSLTPEKSFEVFMQEAQELLEQLTGPVLVLVDLFGGTPSNVLTVLTKKYQHQVLTGINLPMFIDLYLKATALSSINEIETILNEVSENAQAAIVHTNDHLTES